MEFKWKLLLRIIIFIFCGTWLKETNANESGSISSYVTEESTAVATTESYRSSRSYIYRRGGYENNHDDEMVENDEMENTKSMETGKNDYWGGYYDFLINEGSYKFWAAFQLATAVLLIYSGFAALYYAKVNPTTTDDYEDYFLRRRKRHTSPMIFNIDSLTFQRIIEALEKYNFD